MFIKIKTVLFSMLAINNVKSKHFIKHGQAPMYFNYAIRYLYFYFLFLFFKFLFFFSFPFFRCESHVSDMKVFKKQFSCISNVQLNIWIYVNICRMIVNSVKNLLLALYWQQYFL